MNTFAELEAKRRMIGKLAANFKDVTASAKSDTQIQTIKNEIAVAVAESMRPFIVDIVMRQYVRCGIKTRTGQLVGAIRALTMRYKLNGQLQIQVGNVGERIGVKSASLNYGAVYAPKAVLPLIDLPTGRTVGQSKRSIIGEKVKRSVKSAVFGGKILSERQKIAQAAIESESLRYMAPRRFFSFDATTREKINAEFESRVLDRFKAEGLL